MNLSLNETAAMAKKAARGAGYSWGLAEEAAIAVRWLAGFGLDGCAALAEVLTVTDGSVDAHVPSIAGPVWRVPGGSVCPLMSGTAFADRAVMLVGLQTRIENVISPLLLMPFASDAARVTGRVVAVQSADGTMMTDGTAVSGALAPAQGDVDLRFAGQIGAPLRRVRRATPDADAWATLSRFAERTYAPATDASRLLGAGAGTTDND